MKKAVIVSKATNKEALKELLSTEGFDHIDFAETSDQVCRIISGDEDVELILINAPLKEESGLDLAVQCSKSTIASIMVIVRAEKSAEVAHILTSQGIMVIGKPISRHLFHHYLLFSECFKKRIRRVVKENNKLRSQVETMKIVNRAKVVLMKNLRMSEGQAHHYLEKQAMDLRKSKYEVAINVLRTYEN